MKNRGTLIRSWTVHLTRGRPLSSVAWKLSLLCIAAATVACKVDLRGYGGVPVTVVRPARAPSRPSANAHANASSRGHAEAHVDVTANVEVTLPTPPNVEVVVDRAPPAPVALEGAQVVEFFGIPLDDADEVVFVLDRSGSMDLLAQGEIAHLGNAQPANANAPSSQTPYEAPESSPPQPRKIDVAIGELVAAMQGLPAGTRVNVVFFNGSLEAFAPTLLALDEPKRNAIIDFVRETVPDGGRL